MSRDNFDYDTRGQFLAGAGTTSAGEHGTDRFKKPNHPSFSNQSQYHGVDGYQGGAWSQDPASGKWSFVPGETNLNFFGPAGLQRYFLQSDPNVQLNLPQATPGDQSLNQLRTALIQTG